MPAKSKTQRLSLIALYLMVAVATKSVTQARAMRILHLQNTVQLSCHTLDSDEPTIPKVECRIVFERHDQNREIEHCIHEDSSGGSFCVNVHLEAMDRRPQQQQRRLGGGLRSTPASRQSQNITVGSVSYRPPFDNYPTMVASVLQRRSQSKISWEQLSPEEAIAWFRDLAAAHRNTAQQEQERSYVQQTDQQANERKRILDMVELRMSASAWEAALAVCQTLVDIFAVEQKVSLETADGSSTATAVKARKINQQQADLFVELGQTFLLMSHAAPDQKEKRSYNQAAVEPLERAHDLYQAMLNDLPDNTDAYQMLEMNWAHCLLLLGKTLLLDIESAEDEAESENVKDGGAMLVGREQQVHQIVESVTAGRFVQRSGDGISSGPMRSEEFAQVVDRVETRLEKALDVYTRALEGPESVPDQEGMELHENLATTLRCLHRIAALKANYPRAMEYGERALQIYKTVLLPYMESSSSALATVVDTKLAMSELYYELSETYMLIARGQCQHQMGKSFRPE